MKKKDKLSKAEIVWMIWGFFGSCIVGTLIIGGSLPSFTGNVIFNKTSEIISNGLIVFGIFFIMALGMVVISYRINMNKMSKKIKWRKYG